MRPIDGDALIEKYGDWYTEEGTEEGFIGTLKSLIDEQPTIEPRKPGHWIVHRDWIDNGECGYECSECHRCYDYGMNFCGYCGSKMEVEHD